MNLVLTRRLAVSWQIFHQKCNPNNGHQLYTNPEAYVSTRGASHSNDENFNLATHILKPWVQKQPQKPAVILRDNNHTEKMTYSELYSKAELLSRSLFNDEQKDCPKCAIVILPKTTAWWIINIAGSICEFVISPGSTMLRMRDIQYRLEAANVDAIFCDSSFVEIIDEIPRHVKWKICVTENEEEERQLKGEWVSLSSLVSSAKDLPQVSKAYDGESIAQLYFTSGTTANPKMVPHSQRGLGLGHLTSARDWLGLNSEDLLWNLSDLGWAKASYSTLYAPLIAGCTIFSYKNERFDPRNILSVLQKVPVTVICLPPTAYRLLVQEDMTSFKPLNLRRCVSAGEPLNPEVLQTWYKHTGLWIHEGYGQTESTLTCCSSVGMEVKPGRIGKPTADYDVKIVDENLNIVSTNVVGQIAYSLRKKWPPGLFKGYLNNPELNSSVFVNDFYLTGDKAFLDEDGYLCYVGRDDDIINTAGYRVGPFEVESALLEHPAVAESAVVGYPDEERGHLVKAFIVLNEKYKNNLLNGEIEKEDDLMADIQSFMKVTVAPYKYPRKIEFVEALPKTTSGKIRRVELRNRR